jgi:hypothetical protein
VSTDFVLGTRVRLHGLQRADLNGATGVVAGPLTDRGRMPVQLDTAHDRQLALKPENLALAEPQPPNASAMLPDSGEAHLDSAALMLHSANALLRDAAAASEPSAELLAVLAKLPSTTLEEDLPGGQECQICLLQMRAGEELLTLPCFHRYHRACIQRWLTVQRTCPVCKHDALPPHHLPADRAPQCDI